MLRRKIYEGLGNSTHRFWCSWMAGLWMLTLATPAWAQMEPCWTYEIDNQPGYGLPDLHFTASFWRVQGQMPNVPDFNSDGMVNVLDMVQQENCVGPLNPGLLGKYYGFDDGTEGQDIAFPDFNAISFAPTVIRATEELNVFSGWRGFMDSEMRRQFGATFEGYLWVPESANYTLHIFGTRGMRVYLDGAEILFFDGWPSEDEIILPLTRGLHPIHVEFYTDDAAGRILLDWSSDGAVIGPTSQVIGAEYLLHEGDTVPDGTVTDVELLTQPSSGTRTTASSIDVDFFVMSPDDDVRLHIDGQEELLLGGSLRKSLPLSSGLNTFELVASDGAGRTVRKPFHVYRATESVSGNGLICLAWAKEWYDGLRPDVSELAPYDTFGVTGTQLDEVAGFTQVGGRHLSGGNIVNLQGMINIPQTGEYTFRATGGGGIYINGEFVAGIGELYDGQWSPRGTVFLEAGYNHYRMTAGEQWSGPDKFVFWAFEGGAETAVPDSAFRWSANHLVPMKNNATKASGGRVDGQLFAEYIFRPEAPFADSSGNGYDFWPDPRAIPRTGGGLTFHSAGIMTSEEGGVQLVRQIRNSRAFTFEVDFQIDHMMHDYRTRELISLTETNWGSMVRLYIQHDDVVFRFEDDQGNDHELRRSNAVGEGGRYHIVGTWDGSVMRLYINGLAVGNLGVNPVLTQWRNLAHLNVSQSYARRYGPGTSDNQMFGTFFTAAVYTRALSHAEVQTNHSANQALTPTPPPLPAPAPVTYPAPGTTQADLDLAFHVLNRLTFGPNADSVNTFLNMGLDNWLNWQLNPAAIDDSQLETFLAEGPLRPTHYDEELGGWLLTRMILSERQLLEIMTWFWENHFNTQLDKVDNPYQEMAENQRFRTHALGQFEDLLKASALHFPMTVYLDNDSNVVGAPNENYAREILELHTYGVNNGYTHQDIIEAARCFTGWTVRDGEFFFNPGLHDYGEKNLLGITIPAGGGMSDGLTLIRHLVQSQNTADFIAWKLAQVFIDDDPPADVVNAAAATFYATEGNIEQTLRTIFNHARFRSDLAYRGNKTRTPLEFVTAATRLSEAYPVAHTMNQSLRRIGMDMFEYADPTGFAEEGVAWIDTNSLLERWNFVNTLTTNRGNGNTTGMNMERFVHQFGVSDANQILDLFTDLTTHGSEALGTRAIMASWLTNDNPGAFLLDDETLDTRVRQTWTLFLRLAELNRQ